MVTRAVLAGPSPSQERVGTTLQVCLVHAGGTLARVATGLRLYFTSKNHALHAYDAAGNHLRFQHPGGAVSDVLFVAPSWEPRDTRELLGALAGGAGVPPRCEPLGTTGAATGNHAYVLVKA